MFDNTKSYFLRGLSLFHGWLPILLVWCVWRLGYDRRAFPAWTVLAWGVLIVCYVFMPGPVPNPGSAAVNINYVHGWDDTKAQSLMHPLLWLLTLMVVKPLLMFAPTHVVLSRWKGGSTSAEAEPKLAAA
jgi:hypothetical protein